MVTEVPSPKRELTPATKRVLEDDHQPSVSSPLNPDYAKDVPMARERASRAKKESLKKRESTRGPTAGEGRNTPDPKSKKKKDKYLAPQRFKLPPPRPEDFEAPQGPIFTPHHKSQNGLEYYELSDQ